MKEWLQSPEFFETKNKEQLLIEEFKQGKRKGYWNKDYDENTPDDTIRYDENFKKAIKEYKTSKQVMVEDLKNEIVDYYKKQIAEELKTNEMIEKFKNETFEIIAQDFPNMIMQVMISVFASNLHNLENTIIDTAMKANMCEDTIQRITKPR